MSAAVQTDDAKARAAAALAARIARGRAAIDEHHGRTGGTPNPALAAASQTGVGAANVHPFKARVSSRTLDAADLMSDAADRARKRANRAVNKSRGIFAGASSFSVRQAASDAYANRQDSHRAYAAARVHAFMQTKFVSRYPGQTFGERKGQLFKNFTTAVSTYKESRQTIGDMKLARQAHATAHKGTMHALRVKKAEAARTVYKAAVDAGKLVEDPKLSFEENMNVAMGADPQLRKAARAARDQVRAEIKAQGKAFSTQDAVDAKAIKALSKGGGSASRMVKTLFRTGVQTAGAMVKSAKNTDEKLYYQVVRGGKKLVLSTEMHARKAGAVVGGVKHATVAGVAEGAAKVAHVTTNAAHAVTRRGPNAKMA